MKEKLMEVLQDMRPDIDFENETSLVTGKVLDSIDIVALIGAIDEEFDIKIKPAHMKPENFDSVDAIVALLEKLEEDE